MEFNKCVWQSYVEIKHYSVSVKNELTVLIKGLGLPRIVCKCQHYSLLVRVVTPMKVLSHWGDKIKTAHSTIK